ncbi:MAG: hypothetical protein FWE85_03955, partial [Clostridiales bacterium]|nr:hypothetical protein [Clostridiales bacterium]
GVSLDYLLKPEEPLVKGEASANGEPATEKPAPETPVNEKPAPETPVNEKPATEIPAPEAAPLTNRELHKLKMMNRQYFLLRFALVAAILAAVWNWCELLPFFFYQDSPWLWRAAFYLGPLFLAIIGMAAVIKIKPLFLKNHAGLSDVYKRTEGQTGIFFVCLALIMQALSLFLPGKADELLPYICSMLWLFSAGFVFLLLAVSQQEAEKFSRRAPYSSAEPDEVVSLLRRASFLLVIIILVLLIK